MLGYSEAYNQQFKIQNIKPLSRKRLSEMWFTFKLRQINNIYGINVDFIDAKSTEIILDEFNPIMVQKFTEKWTSTHLNICNTEFHKCINTSKYSSTISIRVL